MSQLASGGGADCLPTIIALYIHIHMHYYMYVCRVPNILNCTPRSRPRMQRRQDQAACGMTDICQSWRNILRRRHPSLCSCTGHWFGVFMALNTWIFITFHPIEQTAYLWSAWLLAVQRLSRVPAFLSLCCDPTIFIVCGTAD
jgi:hypothetical protein